MMAEPTLGQRILDAADACADAISEQVVAISRGTWEVAHADAVTDAMDERRALAARADAAERLAVARAALEDISADLREAAFYDTATKALVKRRRAAEAEDAEALAAWRALGEVQP